MKTVIVQLDTTAIMDFLEVSNVEQQKEMEKNAIKILIVHPDTALMEDGLLQTNVDNAKMIPIVTTVVIPYLHLVVRFAKTMLAFHPNKMETPAHCSVKTRM